MSAAAQELARIQAARLRLADTVGSLRGQFADIESELRGAVQRVITVGPGGTGGSRVLQLRNLDAVLSSVPQPSAAQGSAAILAQYGKTGFRERSYDTVVPVTAPNEIDQNGNYYDAAGVYDAWILNPSIDTKIDFSKPPSQNTPFVSANSRMQFAVRAQKVYYLAQNPGTVGVMQIWLLKYAAGT